MQLFAILNLSRCSVTRLKMKKDGHLYDLMNWQKSKSARLDHYFTEMIILKMGTHWLIHLISQMVRSRLILSLLLQMRNMMNCRLISSEEAMWFLADVVKWDVVQLCMRKGYCVVLEA